MMPFMHKYLALFLFTVSCLAGHAQSSSVVIDTLWWDRMGYGGNEVLERMVVAEDNSLWAVGTTSSTELYGQDIYLIHLDSAHQCLGSYSLGGNGVDLGVDLLLLPNGNLLLLGTTSSFSALGYDAVLYVLDSNGQVLEANILEEEGWQYAQRFDVSANGGLSISGKELNASGNWDLRLWKVISTGAMNVYDVEDQMSIGINAQNIESSFVTHGSEDNWWGFASYWNEDSIPQTRAFAIDAQFDFQWDTTNVANGDSILMHDAIVKDDALIMVGGFYHNEQFRPQVMKWQPGLGMWYLANYPNYLRETMFHGIGYTQDSLVYCAVGWSFEFGFGMGGGYFNFFNVNDQWVGNGFIGGDLLCKLNDAVFDKNNKLHSIGLDNSHAQGMSQQAWLVRGDGCLFVQPNTFQLENAIIPCFTVGEEEMEEVLFDFVYDNGLITWQGDAEWLGAYDTMGRKVNFQMISKNQIQLEVGTQLFLLNWSLNKTTLVKKMLVLTN
jgi:hypothetical protein